MRPQRGYNTVVLLSLWSLANNPTPWRRPGRNVPTKLLQKHETKPRNPVLHIRALGLRFHQAEKERVTFDCKTNDSLLLTRDKFKQRWFFYLTYLLRVFFPCILQIRRVLQRTAMLLIFFREYGFLGSDISRGIAGEFLMSYKIAFIKIWEQGNKT